MDLPLAPKSFPGFSHIFRLYEPGASRAFRATLEMTREEAWALLRGEAKRHEPILARWAMGAAKPVDVIRTTLALPVLVSERVIEILRNGQFTGWDVIPVDLRGKNGEVLSGYYFLSVTGRCGPIDFGRSRKVDKAFPAGAFPVWKGLYFDPATWDGSEIFMAEGHGGKLVVEAVRDALMKSKVKNLLFETLDDVERISTPSVR